MAKDRCANTTDELFFGILPHRPPSDEAVAEATRRYVEGEGKTRDLPKVTPTHQRY